MQTVVATTVFLAILSLCAPAQTPEPQAVPPQRSSSPQMWSCTNPISPENGVASACLVARTFWSATESQLFRANGNPNQELTTLRLESTVYTGGSNQPVRSFGKTTYLGSKTTGTYTTMGQHVLVEATQNCFAPGDCLVGSRFLNHANGVRDSSDEGVHLFDTQIAETPYVPTGRCVRGCVRSSEVISLADADAWTNSGEGRFVGDMTHVQLGPGRITGATLDRVTGFTEVAIEGGGLPVSTLLKIPATPQARPGEVDPGGVVVEIATRSLPKGFAASTVAIAPQGILCLADMGGLNHPEMAPYLVLDATHLSLHLRKQHDDAMMAAVGGTCGLGISLLADDAVLLPNHPTPVRQVIPIYGSRTPGSVLLDHQTHLGQNLSSNAFFSLSCPIASIERRGGTVTLEAVGGSCYLLNGLPATLSGTPAQLGTSTSALHLQQLTDRGAMFRYDAPGPDLPIARGGSLVYNNGAYRLIPIAETTRVLNPDTGRPDGANVALAPNLVPFTPGDQIEQFHFHLALTGSAGEQFQTQYTPEIDVPTNTTGVVFAAGDGAVAGPGKIAFRCSNAEADNKLLGYGGTHVAPWMCLRADGAFRNVLDAEWITNGAILRLHPLHHQQSNATPFWIVAIEPGNGDDAGLRYMPDTHALEFSNLHAVAPTYTTTRGTPRSSSEACTAGESWDATDASGQSFHYFCRAKNTIVRARMDSF